jgi:protein-disulfide isomerase
MRISAHLTGLALLVITTAAQAQIDRTPAQIADRARIQGANNAPVWLVIVGDLAGKEDRAFRYEVWPVIDSLFVQTAKIRVAWVNLPDDTSKASRIAAEVAVCASTDRKFWAPHDIILWEQARWRHSPDPTEQLIMLAAQKGARPTVVRECLQKQQMKRFLENDIARARGAGIRRAPGFIIDNDVLTGAPTADALRAAIEHALAKKQSAPRKRGE